CGPVLLVIVVEWKVPPRPVLLLQFAEQLGEVVLVERSVFRLELVNAQPGVVVAKIKEVASDLEMGLMWYRPLPADVQPQVAREKPVEPNLEHTIGDPRISPKAKRQVTGLRPSQTSTGAIDRHHGMPFQILAIEVAEVRLALAQSRI